VVYDTNKVHLILRPERNSGAAIATRPETAISRPASAAVTAAAAVTSSSVPAIAGRSFSNVAANATGAVASVAAVAAIAARSSEETISSERRAAVTARRCPTIP